MKSIVGTITLVTVAAMFAGTAAIAETPTVQSPVTVVYGIPVPVNHVGPGAGSPKHAPFVYLDRANLPGAPGMLFHKTSFSEPAWAHQGPWVGSAKLPFLTTSIR